MPSMRKVVPLGVRTWLEMRLVRVLTLLAARAPWVWKWDVPSALMRGTFDPMASVWESRVSRFGEGWAAPLIAGLDTVGQPPGRALDLGTGTGLGAATLARRYPEAVVTGVDMAPQMIEKARDLHGHLPNLRFLIADSHRLPFNDSGFDLITCLNVPPFFAELSRVTASGGTVVIAFSLGERTPIYLPTHEVERRLRGHGYVRVRSGRAALGVWTVGVKG